MRLHVQRSWSGDKYCKPTAGATRWRAELCEGSRTCCGGCGPRDRLYPGGETDDHVSVLTRRSGFDSWPGYFFCEEFGISVTAAPVFWEHVAAVRLCHPELPLAKPQATPCRCGSRSERHLFRKQAHAGATPAVGSARPDGVTDNIGLSEGSDPGSSPGRDTAKPQAA